MSLETVVILAAGEGTRMKSSTPKVLHPIAGRTLVGHVLNAVDALSPKNVRVVVGAGREQVEAHIAEIAPSAVTIFQEKRGGTGHATQLALAGLKPSGTILVLAGDTPMLTGASLSQLLAEHHAGGFTASVLTAEHPDPTGYGRIVRGDDDSLLRIVEERDADEIQREIIEVNSGVYAFDAAKLASAIGKLKNDNSQGELYLTDVLEILRNEGGKIAAVLIDDFIEILGVNDRVQLAESAALLRDRINEDLMRAGVSIMDPMTTWIDATAVIESDVTIYPGTAILGKTTIASGAVIGPRAVLESCTVLNGAKIIESHCFEATIGEGTNIGAATIFVNYDGVEKHYSVVGDHVRIGSDSMLVAPVTIGDGAYTAAGSVITEDVPAGAIGVGRAKQRNVLGWVLRKRPGTKSAEAAARHSNDEQKG